MRIRRTSLPYLVALSIAGAIFLCSLVLTLFHTIRVVGILNEASGAPTADGGRRHFAVIIPDIPNAFFERLGRGIREGAAVSGAAVDFSFVYGSAELSSAETAMEIALYSEVDGILLYVPDETSLTDEIDAAEAAGIPVVTLENDAPASSRRVFVGTNSFQLGTNAGLLITQARPLRAAIAIILNQNQELPHSAQARQTLDGLESILRNWPRHRVTAIAYSGHGILSSERAAHDVLVSHPEINVILCTSAEDTIGAAITITDANRVGEVTIIGYDLQPDIEDYISKEIVYGVLVRNPWEIGEEGVRALAALTKGEPTQSYVDTGLSIVTTVTLEARTAEPELSDAR